MRIHLIYFAAVRELVGKGEEYFESETNALDLKTLIAELHKKHKRLIMEGVRIAVNEEFVDEDAHVKDGDTVALIPPVSGG